MVAMYGLANCTISVLRGTTANAFGDVIDASVVVASGIPAFINVRSSVISDSATQQPRVVETIIGAIGSNVDIRNTDQLRDDTNGVTYAVETITQGLLAGITADQRLELRRVR